MPKPPRYRPIPFLYDLLRAIGAAFLYLFCGFRRTGGKIPSDGPLLVVASHQGMMDFMTVAEALPGRRVQFIATRRYFRNRLMRLFFRIDGAIPKTQFYPDPAGIAAVFRILREGGTVALFPAGQTSVCGLPETVSPVIARLVKRAGAPVCAVRQHGGFYTLPRFRAHRFCFGRVEAEVSVILTPKELQTLSEGEIYRTLCDAIHFDEAAWQARTGARFRGRHRAEGLENALWCCPRCGTEFSLHGEGNDLICGCCGNRARLGSDMRFVPAMPADHMLPTVTDWYLWQEELLRAATAAPEFRLETEAEALSWDGNGFALHGTGQLLLTGSEICYTGGWEGESVKLKARHESLPGLTTAHGGYIEIYHDRYGLVRYRLPVAAVLPKWKQAQEYLHRQLTGDLG